MAIIFVSLTIRTILHLVPISGFPIFEITSFGINPIFVTPLNTKKASVEAPMLLLYSFLRGACRLISPISPSLASTYAIGEIAANTISELVSSATRGGNFAVNFTSLARDKSSSKSSFRFGNALSNTAAKLGKIVR